MSQAEPKAVAVWVGCGTAAERVTPPSHNDPGVVAPQQENLLVLGLLEPSCRQRPVAVSCMSCKHPCRKLQGSSCVTVACLN